MPDFAPQPPPAPPAKPLRWLGLVIGNSRLHWAYFQGDTLQKTWDSCHLDGDLPPGYNQAYLLENLPLYLASVVPEQTSFWKNYPHLITITLSDIPLQGLYSTLGIDRALAVLGGGSKYGFPCLVVDAGTALTFTGVSGDRSLVGGAIVPGLGLQLETLKAKTAALPALSLSRQLPSRWAVSTAEAMSSGVIYTITAGVKDFIQQWWNQFSGAQIVVTGGDGELLFNYLQAQYPEIAARVILDLELVFTGLAVTIEVNQGQS